MGPWDNIECPYCGLVNEDVREHIQDDEYRDGHQFHFDCSSCGKEIRAVLDVAYMLDVFKVKA